MFKYLCVVALLTTQALGSSQATQVDDSVNRAARHIFETVLSPYCPGRTISNCPSPQADELRGTITTQLEAGKTPEAVEEELYAVFGDELRTIPRARGIGLLAWLVPAIGFIAGAWAIVAWTRRTRSDSSNSVASRGQELDEESDERLKSELAELDSFV